MTCNITATPLDIEPLPLYRRDPETSSLLSSAPSYTSEAPTYHSSARDSQIIVSEPAQQRRQPQPYYVATSLLDISAPPPTRSNHSTAATAATDRPTSTDTQYSSNSNSNSNSNVQRPLLPRPGGVSGLPSPTFAPGFISRAPNAAASDNDALQSGYNIGTWSSVTASSHLQRRQYERVAMRRASRAAGIDRATALLESMKLSNSEDPPTSPVGGESRAETPPPPPSSSSSTTEAQAGDGDRCGGGGGGGRGDALEAGTERSTASASDVGSVASDDTTAATAASTSSPSVSEPVLPLEDPALVVQENKSWDFMLSQMADWEERERSWSKFRSEVEMRQGRIRAMGVGIGRLGGFAIGDGSRSRGKKWSLGKVGAL
ncbi:uncharacterized protein LTHEOB_3288 [Lasiodiplodia theobromae]|uniref:uncharacterized protein n=1 Tax=Lasiodiplodia theobromae TaxID=45133 RepID=UPI0015C3BF69|nr:uncharacterized protein LTHEOB_3288 [Lasiodiplodia theobromae]KAF4534480.1 hypothetical protein LTHEOB_3288 [Lasiodiplodia theobromae]